MNTVNKNLDIRAFLVFQRLQRFYKTLNVVSALLAGLSLAVLTFTEFHPTQSGLMHASEGLLCSSALTSVISVMISTMLLFKFEGRQSATRKDLAIAWTPLAIMDLAIVEFLCGLVLWYSGKNNGWRTALMSSQFAFWLGYCVWTSFWMWDTMSDKGGLGGEDAQAATGMKRAAYN
jgi:ABC-type xylose transport system permease subunit